MVECAATASSVLPFRVQKMGWAVQLLEKSSSYSSETSFDSGMSDNTSTQLVFVAQTVEHVYLWDSVPWTIKEWSSPRDQILLLRARILSPQSWSNHLAVNDNPLGVSRPPHRSTNSVASSPMTTSKIAIRYGGDQGLACYSFQLTTRLAHTAWLASLVQGTLAAARNIGHAKFDCVWKNQECKLTIHLERGFILTDSKSGKDLWTHPYNTFYASNDDALGIAFGIISPNVPPFMYSIFHSYLGKDLWTHPYNTLSASNDDGAKLLWLQFRGSPHEDEFVLQVNPKVVVFTIHNFLSAKLQLIGKSVQ